MNSNFCNRTKSLLHHHTHHVHKFITKYQKQNSLCTINNRKLNENNKSDFEKIPKYLPLKKFVFNSIVKAKVTEQPLVKYTKRQNYILNLLENFGKTNIYQLKYFKMINKLLHKPESLKNLRKKSQPDDAINRIVDNCVQQILQCFPKNTEKSKSILKSRYEKIMEKSRLFFPITNDSAPKLPPKKFGSVAVKKLNNNNKKRVFKVEDSTVKDASDISRLGKSNEPLDSTNVTKSMISFYKPKHSNNSSQTKEIEIIKSDNIINESDCKCVTNSKSNNCRHADKVKLLNEESRIIYEKKLKGIIQKIQKITADVFLVKKQIDTLILNQQKEVINNKMDDEKNKTNILQTFHHFQNTLNNRFNDNKNLNETYSFTVHDRNVKLLDKPKNLITEKNISNTVFQDISIPNSPIKDSQESKISIENKFAEKIASDGLKSDQQQCLNNLLRIEYQGNQEMKKTAINENQTDEKYTQSGSLEKIQKSPIIKKDEKIEKKSNDSKISRELQDVGSQTDPSIMENSHSHALIEKSTSTNQVDSLIAGTKQLNFINNESNVKSNSSNLMMNRPYISDDPFLEMVRQNRMIDEYENLAKNKSFTAIFFTTKVIKKILFDNKIPRFCFNF